MRFQYFIIILVIGAAASIAMARGTGGVAVGPPLVCFPYEIGDAKSLPWNATRDEPFTTDPKYDESKLIDDTLQILDGSPEILVHMETLRRAAIYAARFDAKPTKGREGSLATRLTTTVLDRALKQIAADAKNPIYWIDAGYALGATQHMSQSLGRFVSWVEYFEKAVSLAKSDATVLFAASTAYLDSPKSDRWAQYFEESYFLAPSDSLLKKNLVLYGERYLGAEKFKEMTEVKSKLSAPDNTKKPRK